MSLEATGKLEDYFRAKMSGFLRDMIDLGAKVYHERPGLFAWLVLLGVTVCVAPFVIIPFDLYLGIAHILNVFLILAFNCPLLCNLRGFNKLMSAGHLPSLIPLVIYSVLRLSVDLGPDDEQPQINPPSFLFWFNVILVVPVITICTILDIKETVLWIRGDHEPMFLASSQVQPEERV